VSCQRGKAQSDSTGLSVQPRRSIVGISLTSNAALAAKPSTAKISDTAVRFKKAWEEGRTITSAARTISDLVETHSAALIWATDTTDLPSALDQISEFDHSMGVGT
jgi:hypothetical protein